MPKINIRKPEEPSSEGVVRIEFPERNADNIEDAVELASRLILDAIRDGRDVDVVTTSYAVAKVAQIVGEQLGGGPYEPFGSKVFRNLYNLEIAKALGQLGDVLSPIRKDGLENFAELLEEALKRGG